MIEVPTKVVNEGVRQMTRGGGRWSDPVRNSKQWFGDVGRQLNYSVTVRVGGSSEVWGGTLQTLSPRTHTV